MRLCVPYLDRDEETEVVSVLRSGYLTQGVKVIEFENLIRDYIGARYCFAMSSCTTALHLSLVALGLKPGDEVLVPDFTFPATANVVVHLQCKPILVDIRTESFTIDPEKLEALITDRTRAIIPVHAFGCSADMDSILSIAGKHKLSVIEDAACAIGTTYKGKKCGALAEVGCFSFHPRKVITTGEGGMIATNDEKLANRVRLLRSHGGVKEEYYFRYDEAGFNYRLSDILGAVGVAQMRKLEIILAKRRELAQQLKDLLQDIEEITLPHEPSWGGHIYQSFVVLLDDRVDRDKLISFMRNADIETTLGTYALHEQPYFQRTFGYRSGQLPNSSRAFRKSLTLPLYPDMKANDARELARCLKSGLVQQ